jgi:transcriptional regulator with XRE-family HTH domain
MKRKPVASVADLIAWRERHKLSQEKAASIFGLKRRAYQNIESGKLKTWPKKIDKLAQLYEIRPRSADK